MAILHEYVVQKRLNGNEVSTTYYLIDDFAVQQLPETLNNRFVIQRPILTLATNLYFLILATDSDLHDPFIFQPTNLFFNNGFLLQNYGADPHWRVIVIKKRVAPDWLILIKK